MSTKYNNKEITTMMYFKSIYTGQVYAMSFIPQFGGYELATKEEYEAYCISKFGKVI